MVGPNHSRLDITDKDFLDPFFDFKDLSDLEYGLLEDFRDFLDVCDRFEHLEIFRDFFDRLDIYETVSLFLDFDDFTERFDILKGSSLMSFPFDFWVVIIFGSVYSNRCL